ncbi:FecR family protein [Fodinibius salsisoli]|uniref:FecR domain-containing protein n=1 Tax=Fodinibius salsisoli TaxID=2820877 RepID=A0ABT3PSG9_9BACT|nr:FecR family protein [Fodinibius salsisoli]MCW9708800.1 FecR domain-containing protein [Fodinibius salsisoli]
MTDEKLLKYFKNACTEGERQEVESWLQANDHNAQYYLDFVQARHPAAEPEYDKEKVKARLLDEVQYAMHSNTQSGTDFVRRIVDQNIQWLKAAAAILVILIGGMGGYVWFGGTLSDHSEIGYREFTVPAGKIDSLMLGDGTKVTLNAGTTLKYPEQFIGGSRKVYLVGEAYFDVAHNKAKPFKVQAGALTTTVLGTAFNVTAYREDQQVSVAVTEGKVRVADSGTQRDQPQELTLTPNQSLAYDKQTKRVAKQEGVVSDFISWKEGILIFNEEPLPETVRKLERWYDVNISIPSSGLAGCIIHGKHKGESLDNVLKTISFATGISYEFTEQGVAITGGRCQ